MSSLPSSQTSWIRVDERFTPADEAWLSPLDRGFLHGDSVFETLRSFGGELVLLERHLDRLERSAAALGLDWPLPRAELARELGRDLAHCRELSGGTRDFAIRLVLTRGPGPRGIDLEGCRSPSRVVAWTELLEDPLLGPDDHPGIDLRVVARRRAAPDALDPGVKSGNYLNSVLARREAKSAGGDEALFLDREGHVAEASTANLFLVRAGALATPQLGFILPGITRSLVLELARDADLPMSERAIAPDELLEADELFLTSSIEGLRAVGAIEGQRLGDGRAGPVTQTLRARLRVRLGLT